MFLLFLKNYLQNLKLINNIFNKHQIPTSHLIKK